MPATVMVEQPVILVSGAIRDVSDKFLDRPDGGTAVGSGIQVRSCVGGCRQGRLIANHVGGISGGRISPAGIAKRELRTATSQ